MSTATTLSISRANLVAAAVFALSSVTALSTASAQNVIGSRGFEVRPYAGAYIPTGDQRDLLEDAVLVGAQASYWLRPQLAITGTFGWSTSKDRISVGNEKLDLYQYDIGAELRAPSWFTSGTWDFTPFAGLGVGGRTYDYRDLDDVDAKTNVAGFGVDRKSTRLNSSHLVISYAV